MYDATSNHLWQLRFEEHEPFSLRGMKPAWLPASTAQDCSIRKSNDFWCIALQAERFWKAIIHVCKQSFDALGAERQVVITCLANNSTRQGLIRCSCNVKQSFTFRVLTRIFRSFWFRDGSVDILVVEVETKQIINLLHHRSPNQSFFCTKTILFSFAAYFLPMCTAFLCSNTATSIKRPLLCKRRCSHVQKSTNKKSGQTASS